MGRMTAVKAKHFILLIILTVFAGLLSGCGTTDGGLLDTGSAVPMGQVTVAVHDAPMAGLEEFLVTLDSVRVRSNGEWIDLGLETPWTQDLLLLQGEENAMDVITADLPVGDYDAVELRISDVSYTMNGASGSLDLPAGGVLVTVQVDFTVAEDGALTVKLHFDVEGSMALRGTDVIFNPSVLLSGVIDG